ncbi:hypothetical protein CBM2626_B140123 [Cupriavidus taiwanensis]|uniref:Uncharacterized protein n=1 Tax=Cupriavidus taiwanensis TaxID=164546 RepID=A0A375EAN6_9BURK|nr:hypothetical protein CBM2614_B200258 [Cupriavidus taiwanensis]SOZ67300.1 hypothetical protein CBM2615_B190256 [Cupriavidus taiwanensis]SOZ70782.1 hypothetical protein CBM2613_B170221 [Cupriavidus taiwanensis]SPA02225.1 hypothetical protein CBM2626_B140123 [Cupriavidus taiwanensis]SPA08934.1 hypothetical protein CBM2625_B170256 [Cupriavidus taiwanensis]
MRSGTSSPSKVLAGSSSGVWLESSSFGLAFWDRSGEGVGPAEFVRSAGLFFVQALCRYMQIPYSGIAGVNVNVTRPKLSPTNKTHAV